MPGARVTVGFEPRASDRWPVGGSRPTALPGGRLDGTSMRHQGKPSPASDSPLAVLDGGVDVPTETQPATPATNASFSESEAAATAPSDAVVSSTGLRREIFGFLPYWQVNSSTLRLDYSKISTIAYFGVGADAAGNLQKKNADGTTTVGWSGWTSSKMTSIIAAAHTNRTRVVLTVQSFAWNTSGLTRQKALLGSSTARLNLARQIAAAVRDRGADGVNLDFEPLASTYDAEFTALVRSVRAELDKVHSGYQLTFDTTGSIGNYPIENATAPGGADAIFIMGYDYRSSASSPVGSIAPLTRTGYDIRDTVAAYTARVAPSKLILGVPYYGRAWSTSSDAVHATNTSSTKTGASTTVLYSTAAGYLAQYGRRLEATEQVAWTAYKRENCTTTYGCVTSWRQLYIDDAATLGAKYDIVNSYNLRGAGIWALGYDGTRPELWGAIENKFVTDTVPPVVTSASITATAFSPNGDGVADSISLSLAASGATGWSFSAAPVSGTTIGVPVRTGSGSGARVTFVWDGRANSGAGVADGTWRLSLEAADGSGNRVNRAWDVRLDRIAPDLAATAPARFSPNGDGAADTATLAWTSPETMSGTARIYHGTALVRSWTIAAA
ncbi:MAG: glycosyl hydrolase family 18 protein, partial [Chloroflexota bacterium]|nr:glycosyl hydrolase family 18 protein [Chloroflexota bacterium]